MPGPAFRCREAAAGVDRRGLVEQRQIDLLDAARQRPRGDAEGAGECAATVASRPIEHHAARHREAQRSQRPRASADRALGEDLVQRRSRRAPRASWPTRCRASSRAARRPWPAPPCRALEADDALQGGGNADRAAGVGAERDPRRAGGHRDGAARLEPPGTRGVASRVNVAGLAGVPKCGLMPMPENANSDMLVRPRSAAPARRKRATAIASAVAAGAVGEHQASRRA